VRAFTHAPAVAFELALDAPQFIKHGGRVASQQDEQRQRRRVAEAQQLRLRVCTSRVWREAVDAWQREEARHKLLGDGVGHAKRAEVLHGRAGHAGHAIAACSCLRRARCVSTRVKPQARPARCRTSMALRKRKRWLRRAGYRVARRQHTACESSSAALS
jgi:hypothetical protein